MTARQCLSTGLIVALITATVPATTWAAGPDQPQKPATGNLHQAITRVTTENATNPSFQLLPMRPTQDPNVRKQGSGGHAMMVMTIVGSLVGVAATVYMVKQLQKTEKQATTPTQ